MKRYPRYVVWVDDRYIIWEESGEAHTAFYPCPQDGDRQVPIARCPFGAAA